MTIIGTLLQDAVYGWKGDTTQTWAGMWNYWVRSFNANMQKKHGQHFINALDVLQKHAAKKQADSLCLLHDVTPESLRNPGNNLHLNTAGYRYLDDEIISRLVICQ